MAGSSATTWVSFADSDGNASGVEEAIVSGVDVELTDIGGSGSRILDAGDVTDIALAAAADWLNTAASWDLVRPSGKLPLLLPAYEELMRAAEL